MARRNWLALWPFLIVTLVFTLQTPTQSAPAKGNAEQADTTADERLCAARAWERQQRVHGDGRAGLCVRVSSDARALQSLRLRRGRVGDGEERARAVKQIHTGHLLLVERACDRA